MSIELTGIHTPDLPETRNIANIKIEHNGQIYDWQVYMPHEVNISEYLESIETNIKAGIDVKELEWANLDPKYREVADDLSGDVIVVPIEKSEIVRPEIPDYFAKRRNEYPPIGDQLDAMWKGVDSSDFQSLAYKIQQVKDKYPKL